MIDLLRACNYQPPIIVPGHYGRVEIRANAYQCCYLFVDGQQWMAYNKITHGQAFELYSHYHLARGHVTVTGIGFGARENWILSRNEVTKLTIIENNADIIQYHHSAHSPFLRDPRVEIINADAMSYRGTCDVLLLDHFEREHHQQILTAVQQIQNNIICDTMWFWPLEQIIMNARRWYTKNDTNNIITKHQAFLRIKDEWSLDRLPDPGEPNINLYCMMFNSDLFSRSEKIILKNLWPDNNSDADPHSDFVAYI